ncbi:Quinate repressor protein [Fusarium oxysporum f. sp. cubense race 1]|uniref:Quinate repressor protein n=1 Tax=Fusarium oxysporum f. sp. cubense (strain race 1) TaxID=1229664 RepID=N4TT08_FUSC1|nr:Quinate repressor protein [Fusarium oxysporum f. sp. cubense race 1]
MRLVETDRCFCTMTGSTAVEFLKKHGKEALQARETEILQHILEKHASNTIIVVATRTTDIPACRGLLQRFSEAHPVIHILRYQDQVAQHLQGRISRQDVQRMYDVAVPHYRSLANYEFFVSGTSPNYLTSRTISVPSFLSLKGVERDFLGFLRFIHGQQRHTGFLLPPEDTELSRILVVPFPPQGDSLHLEQVHGVHAIQLRLSFPSTLNTDWSALLNHISCISASVRFCSFGSVIAHSIAPSVHNAAFAALGLSHRYGVTESNVLNEALTVMHASDFGGLACANPYKQMMISLLDEISDHARAINAVNTVYPRRTPSRDEPLLCGENTDWIGIVSCIKRSLSPINTVTLKTSALVIGAGGVARAAIYGLLHLGVTTIFIYNRTVGKAEILARHFNHIAERLGEKLRSTDRMRPTEERHCRFTIIRSLNNAYTFDNEVCPPSIIINALPDGEKEPVSSTLDLPLSWFSRPTGGVYIETAYKIHNSVLQKRLCSIELGNWVYVAGKELFVEQGLPQIELWTGMLAPRRIMREAVGLDT